MAARLDCPQSFLGDRVGRVGQDGARKQPLDLVNANAVLLPLARRRLTEADLKELGRDMAARRGIVYPG